ncbi:3-phosphoshikimate 1-carboxyvinyltransferase [Gilvimarinus agarilyticus]|uniref:3-phosphoshikimate 1-carboxyvinyltransferase n=1 Tax=unclassified Gilvimarinus TaxID=2642066 RepID=UPI001C086A12|nr:MULTISPECIES: 3-phosphoshikimate 1-carboxyvinyltransferase [unclassified Gilvimarinus]MBU2886876.1 3-phosphoshikimate 1-carboxyvinyltransferase [Gilvimarinus agarilyticus]MDO6571537.1 3-phosphoshikimate 1-carboxyvinyltransferase [Gilvimarinus sp. 2_MG-2023]MDO6747940.1 3-phosphoshikimate 1-carboxyvinyltransferase [Gilvimarinus sp. 1_MG-2023]
METLTLKPIRSARGEVTLPGSKSLSNRILLLAALAQGETTITNLLDSDDVSHMLTALKALGVDYTLSEDKKTCRLTGLAGVFQAGQSVELFLGNAGTAVRPLTAALAISEGTFTITGEPRMYERPIGDLIDALRQLGAEVTYLKDDGFPPLTLQGKPLNGGEVSIKGNISSQYLTALLMIAPLLQSTTCIKVDGELVSKPYIDITLDTMAKFGVQVTNNDYQSFEIQGQQTYQSPGEIMVEGDASSASYFLAAAAIGGGPVKVHGTGSASIQGDAKFADVLQQMGAKVTYADMWIEVEAGSELNGVDVDLNHIPDAAMTIATTALFAKGPTRIRNIYNWRVKETDRLAAMATELRKVGARVEEGEDYIYIEPPTSLTSAAIDTYNDHRMAMCFSLASFGDVDIVINDPKCTSKTFPTYFAEFNRITKA